MLAKGFRLLLGLFLIPVCIGSSYAFYHHLLLIRRVGGAEITLLLGVTSYLALHALFGSPSRAYVFGHELTHAAAAWVSGGEVKGFKAGAKKGSVVTNKITGFIALAPYLVPVYAVLIALLYGGAGLFWDVRPYIRWLFFGLGMSMTFHLVFTVEALKQKQSDLEVLGPLLSLGLIYLANLGMVIGVICLIVSDVRFLPYVGDSMRYSGAIYQALFSQLFR